MHTDGVVGQETVPLVALGVSVLTAVVALIRYAGEGRIAARCTFAIESRKTVDGGRLSLRNVGPSSAYHVKVAVDWYRLGRQVGSLDLAPEPLMKQGDEVAIPVCLGDQAAGSAATFEWAELLDQCDELRAVIAYRYSPSSRLRRLGKAYASLADSNRAV